MKRLSLLVAVPLVALLVAGCAAGTVGRPAAATVNGTVITRASLFDDLDALRSSPAVRESFGVDGASDDAYDMGFVSQVLSARIIDVLVMDELERRGIEITDADREQARQAYEQAPAAGEVPESFRDRQIETTAARNLLSLSLTEEAPAPDDVTDEDVRAYYDDNIDEIMERVGGEIACVSHILVSFTDAAQAAEQPTPEQEQAAGDEAEALAARITDGEDFGSVAVAESDDPNSAPQQGDLGCLGPDAGFPPEFEEAVFAEPVGAVSSPVRTDFGYHLILVRNRGIVPFEEVRDQIEEVLVQESQAQQQSPFDLWLAGALADAEVDVDPQFGTYSPGQGQQLVVPPEGPQEPEVTVPGLGPPTP